MPNAGTPIAAVSPAQFREAMSRFAASVHVLASHGAAGNTALTVSAVSPVSDSPPTILVCIKRTSPTLPIVLANRAFSISTLAAGEEEVARRFAGRPPMAMTDRMRSVRWTRDDEAPVVEGAIASFCCVLVASKEIATHAVLFGTVTSARHSDARPPLLHVRRHYTAPAD